MNVDLIVNRRLRMWSFSVSHGELILMSTNDSGEYATRFYVLLKPVAFISLPTDFHCQRIRSIVADGAYRYDFIAGDQVHSVVAEHLFHGEDHEPWNAPVPIGIAG